MRLVGRDRIYSATDLTNFLACAHLTQLQVQRLGGLIDPPLKRPLSTADLAVQRGLEHESRYLGVLQAEHGDELVRIENDSSPEGLLAAVEATAAAMRAGAPVIFQAALLKDSWMGYADFVMRVEEPSNLGDWSYLPLDTKYARSVKPYFAIQLCSYAELIEEIQGVAPRQLDLVLGDNSRHSLRFEEFRSYYRRLKARFLATMGSENSTTYPLPVEHCEVCDWAGPCEERRVADDHLSLVANLGRSQAIKFEAEGVATVADLAVAGSDCRPRGMSESTFERFRSQATLQVEERQSGDLSLVLHEPADPEGEPREGPRGFGLLPEPNEGDLFFDIEGDPFYDDGLEYLWGVTYREKGELTFRSFWGLDHAGEKRAFEEFVDFVIERRRLFPGMHVYHYAPYERTALGRLMGRYGTREDEVDRLFRERILVDLYRVVEQSMRISRPSYSLKEVERFYNQDREAEVKQAGDSVLLFEQWLDSGDETLLEKIEAYNKDDCDSTAMLRDWLLEHREECESQYRVEIPWRTPGAPEEGAETTDPETEALRDQLLEGIDETEERSPEQASRWLLAQLLDYHRREAKPAWWEFFDRLERSDLALIEQDSEAIGGLTRSGDPQPMPPPAQSSTQRFQFPTQEHKIKPGKYKDPHSCGIDPATRESDKKPKTVEVLNVDNQEGTLTLKLSAHRLAEDQTALIPNGPIPTPLQQAALREVAAEVAEHGLDGVRSHRAGVDILRRALPRTDAVAAGADLQGESVRPNEIGAAVAGLEDSYLFVQGPPGSGKTYTGAQVICDLIAAGKRVGVTATSHKAIINLLAATEAAALERGVDVRGLKKSAGGEEDYVPNEPRPEGALISNSKKSGDLEAGEELNLLAGTAWLWCREGMRSSVDCLVIDEAGQISLADAVALSTAAANIVLLGDPLQLAQVSQGTHPPGSGVSVLEHLLGEHGTIPPQRGFFLDKTRRMHPDICRFVSRAVYEGRLHWEDFCELQRVDSAGELSGTGVRSIPVAHNGNSRESPEEAEVIVAQIASLRGASVTDSDGETSELTQSQILVVTPYNSQVRCLREHLDDHGLTEVEAGTVDKFQGQEAAVVFFSMATSSGAEIPRNVEFLYSRNRLNVAISRAKSLAVLVASPDLMSVECRTIEQMRLVNALCLLDEMGQEIQLRREG